MYQQNEEIKIIFVDICSISAEFDRDWAILSKNAKIIFLATDDIEERKEVLLKTGEVYQFNGLNNPFSVLADNNTFVRILEKYSFNSNEAIIITASYEHLEYFAHHNIKSAHITKQRCNYKIAPDFICQSVIKVNDIITGENGGFFAEAAIENNLKGRYYSLLKSTFEVNEKQFAVWAGGRYFSFGTAQSHYHLLSSKILSNKRDGRESANFTGIFLRMITRYISVNENLVIVAVPPKPGKINRFVKILDSISKRLKIENGINYLYCNEDYGNNKLRGAQDREKSLDGVFSISKQVDLTNRDIIIVDDVLASGATIKEISKILFDAGTNSVTAFVIGINQLTSQWRNVRYIPLECPLCAGEMILRINNRNLNPFYGCVNYPNCRYTMDYNEGYKKIKEQNIMRAIDTGEGVEF